MRRISIKVRQFCRDSVVRMQKWLCPSVNIWQIANHSIWHKEHQHLLWRSLLYFFIVSEEAQALYKLFITKTSAVVGRKILFRHFFIPFRKIGDRGGAKTRIMTIYGEQTVIIFWGKGLMDKIALITALPELRALRVTIWHSGSPSLRVVERAEVFTEFRKPQFDLKNLIISFLFC